MVYVNLKKFILYAQKRGAFFDTVALKVALFM